MALALRSSAGGGVAGIEETSVRALVKLEQVLPSRLRRRVNALQAYTVAVTSSGPTVDPHTLATIAAACRDHRGPADRLRGRGTAPRACVRWSRCGWSTGAGAGTSSPGIASRNAWRTFRADRLRLRSPNGPGFPPREPPAEDIAAYVTHNVRSVRMRFEALVTVRTPAAQIVERVPPEVVVEPIDENTCVVHAGGGTIAMLAPILRDAGCRLHGHRTARAGGSSPAARCALQRARQPDGTALDLGLDSLRLGVEQGPSATLACHPAARRSRPSPACLDRTAVS